ncbi:MAG: glutathione S-transferase N-terminal domain-containing protein [Hyphomicrobium sp.]|nr:glutathione S-transferase N-terminal domain-containing protein [Hyphomicrobium sp.]
MPKNKHTKPIELHFWPTPNGQKIAIALEELDLPYVIHPVNITRGHQFKPEYLAISPNNKMPAIVDPDGPGGEPVSIFESGAILQYLARRTGKLRGKGKRDRLVVEQWLFWQVAGFGPMAGQAHHFRHYAPEKIQYGIDRYTKELTRLYGVLDKQLVGRDFIADKYSIADIASYPWALNWEKQGQDISAFPNVKAWLARIGARPAVIRGMAAGKDLAPQQVDLSKDNEAQKVLFGNRSKS